MARRTKPCPTCEKPFWCKDLHKQKFCSRACVRVIDRRRKVFCRDCPLRAACAVEGAKGEQGVWGGVLYLPAHDPVDLLAPVLAGVS